MKSCNKLRFVSPLACLFCTFAVLPIAQAQQLPKNGLRIPYTIALTATSELDGEPKEWTKNGVNYIEETTKFDVFRVGNKQLLEMLLNEGIIEDGAISGWSLVEYLQTSGSYDDEGMFQQGAFLVKTGREPIDVSEYLGYTLTDREVESGKETYTEKDGVYSETSKYSGQCIGKIQFADVTIGSGLAKYTDTWSGTWSEYDYDYNSTWSYSPQTFSISGISGWLGGESEDDDPYGEPNIEPYYPADPWDDFSGSYSSTVEGVRLYFYDYSDIDESSVYYYADIASAWSGPFYDSNGDAFYPDNTQNQFSHASSFSDDYDGIHIRLNFYDSTSEIFYYSMLQYDTLNYFREIYVDEEEEDPVLIQGSIRMSGKGTAIRLPEQDYYPY
jgi:hypothetical protein